MDWGPSGADRQKPEVGSQVPDQDRGGPSQPEEEGELGEGAGKSWGACWGAGRSGAVWPRLRAVGGGSRCLGTLLRGRDRQQAMPLGCWMETVRDWGLDQGTL